MNQPRTPEDVFRHSSDLLQKGDLDGWLALFAGNVVFEFPFAPPGRPARIEGRAALADYVRARAQRLAAPTVDRLQVYTTQLPEVIVAEMAVRGGSAPGQERAAIAVVTVHDGLIVKYRDYWSPLVLDANNAT